MVFRSKIVDNSLEDSKNGDNSSPLDHLDHIPKSLDHDESMLQNHSRFIYIVIRMVSYVHAYNYTCVKWNNQFFLH